MALCPSKAIEISSQSVSESSDFDNDDEKFCEVVFEFIERIGKEVTLYENYGPKISENDFRHIEMQIQAERVEMILKLCIKKINLIIFLSTLIEHKRDYLKLLFMREHGQKIEQFAQKWFDQTVHGSKVEFNSDLNECLDILGKYVTIQQEVSLI